VRVVFSDASDTGFGGYTVEHGGLIANGQWSREVAQQSSTWRELRAVRLVLEFLVQSYKIKGLGGLLITKMWLG